MKKLLTILLVSLGLQIQAQVNPCDSITYWTDQAQILYVGLDTTNLTYPDSIEVLWQVCNTSTCYSGSGINTSFGQVVTSDTIKICYDAILYTSNMMEVCTHCDSLIYNGFNWVLFSMGNPTSVNELQSIWKNNGKAYDLLGRELKHIPKGTIYIKNGVLYR